MFFFGWRARLFLITITTTGNGFRVVCAAIFNYYYYEYFFRVACTVICNYYYYYDVFRVSCAVIFNYYDYHD